MKTATTLQEKMFAEIERWLSSGQDRKAFCQQEGINYQKLGYWYKKYRQAHQLGSSFVDVELPTNPITEGYTLQYPNGIVLHCPANIALSSLKNLLSL
jgi:elongation factor P hydroxylase